MISTRYRDARLPLSSPTSGVSRWELHNEFIGNERAGNEGTNGSLSPETSRADTKQPLRRFRCRKSDAVSNQRRPETTAIHIPGGGRRNEKRGNP